MSFTFEFQETKLEDKKKQKKNGKWWFQIGNTYKQLIPFIHSTMLLTHQIVSFIWEVGLTNPDIKFGETEAQRS